MKRKFYHSTKRKIDVELINHVKLVKRIKLVLISKRKINNID